MGVRLVCLMSAVIVLWSTGGRGVAQEIDHHAPKEINVTSDSERRWLPSAIQRQQALDVVEEYLSSLDDNRYEHAYSMMTEENRNRASLPQFTKLNAGFQHQAGPLKQRRILKVTWSKNPSSAPLPGIYAAIDVAGSYANADRSCGYLVLYQKSPVDRFEVMRRENNFISNRLADQIEREKSRAELDRIWAGLAANCPNYKPG